MAYSNSGGLGTPNCPSTHPVAVPQVMYEIMWDTGKYKNDAWYKGKQPFVYSFGDGYVVSSLLPPLPLPILTPPQHRLRPTRRLPLRLERRLAAESNGRAALGQMRKRKLQRPQGPVGPGVHAVQEGAAGSGECGYEWGVVEGASGGCGSDFFVGWGRGWGLVGWWCLVGMRWDIWGVLMASIDVKFVFSAMVKGPGRRGVIRLNPTSFFLALKILNCNSGLYSVTFRV